MNSSKVATSNLLLLILSLSCLMFSNAFSTKALLATAKSKLSNQKIRTTSIIICHYKKSSKNKADQEYSSSPTAASKSPSSSYNAQHPAMAYISHVSNICENLDLNLDQYERMMDQLELQQEYLMASLDHVNAVLSILSDQNNQNDIRHQAKDLKESIIQILSDENTLPKATKNKLQNRNGQKKTATKLIPRPPSYHPEYIVNDEGVNYDEVVVRRANQPSTKHSNNESMDFGKGLSP